MAAGDVLISSKDVELRTPPPNPLYVVFLNALGVFEGVMFDIRFSESVQIAEEIERFRQYYSDIETQDNTGLSRGFRSFERVKARLGGLNIRQLEAYKALARSPLVYEQPSAQELTDGKTRQVLLVEDSETVYRETEYGIWSVEYNFIRPEIQTIKR